MPDDPNTPSEMPGGPASGSSEGPNENAASDDAAPGAEADPSPDTGPDASPEPIDMLAPLFREQPLPPEGMEAPPMWLWMTIFGVLLFSTFYLGSYIGDFSPDPWLQSSKPVASAEPAAEPEPVSGSQIYASRCANCHQNNGEGVANAFPPLNQARWVTDNKGQIIRILLHGLIGEIEVRGSVYNGNMPAWGNQLSDAEIAAVITHVRQSWDNDASEVTAEEVKAVRDATAGRATPWTPDELMEPPNMEVPNAETPNAEAPAASTSNETAAVLHFIRAGDV
jgi:mono/diheme cytochrome c family protein